MSAPVEFQFPSQSQILDGCLKEIRRRVSSARSPIERTFWAEMQEQIMKRSAFLPRHIHFNEYEKETLDVFRHIISLPMPPCLVLDRYTETEWVQHVHDEMNAVSKSFPNSQFFLNLARATTFESKRTKYVNIDALRETTDDLKHADGTKSNWLATALSKWRDQLGLHETQLSVSGLHASPSFVNVQLCVHLVERYTGCFVPATVREKLNVLLQHSFPGLVNVIYHASSSPTAPQPQNAENQDLHQSSELFPGLISLVDESEPEMPDGIYMIRGNIGRTIYIGVGADDDCREHEMYADDKSDCPHCLTERTTNLIQTMTSMQIPAAVTDLCKLISQYATTDRPLVSSTLFDDLLQKVSNHCMFSPAMLGCVHWTVEISAF